MSISQNERARAIFRSRRQFQTDLQSDLATAEDKGRTAGIFSSLQSLMENMELSLEQAMNALNIPETDRAKYRSMLNDQ